jgi:acyl dehydratase
VAEDLPGPGSVFLNTNWNFRSAVRPGDTITAWVKISKLHEDKPIIDLACRITNQDDVTVLEGTAIVWKEPLS